MNSEPTTNTAQVQFSVCVDVLDDVLFPVATVDTLSFVPVSKFVSKQLFINLNFTNTYVVVFPSCVPFVVMTNFALLIPCYIQGAN